jgi:hypothetical protein
MRALRGNMFRNTVAVMTDDGQETEFTLEEWQSLHPRRTELPVSSPPGEQRREPDFLVLAAAPETTGSLENPSGGDGREENPLPAEAPPKGRARRHRRKSAREPDRDSGPH